MTDKQTCQEQLVKRICCACWRTSVACYMSFKRRHTQKQPSAVCTDVMLKCKGHKVLKYCIQEILNLSTNANSSTDTNGQCEA